MTVRPQPDVMAPAGRQSADFRGSLTDDADDPAFDERGSEAGDSSRQAGQPLAEVLQSDSNAFRNHSPSIERGHLPKAIVGQASDNV